MVEVLLDIAGIIVQALRSNTYIWLWSIATSGFLLVLASVVPNSQQLCECGRKLLKCSGEQYLLSLLERSSPSMASIEVPPILPNQSSS